LLLNIALRCLLLAVSQKKIQNFVIFVGFVVQKIGGRWCLDKH